MLGYAFASFMALFNYLFLCVQEVGSIIGKVRNFQLLLFEHC